MYIKNLTPHPVTVFLTAYDKETGVTYPVRGPAPRLEVKREKLSPIWDYQGYHNLGDGWCYDDEGNIVAEPFCISVCRSTMGDPVGLPEEEEGVALIVSALIAEHPSTAHRSDLFYPGEAVRDADGKIVGCLGLCAGPGYYTKAKKVEDTTRN